jgi:hypothetical protein
LGTFGNIDCAVCDESADFLPVVVSGELPEAFRMRLSVLRRIGGLAGVYRDAEIPRQGALYLNSVGAVSDREFGSLKHYMSNSG